MAQNIKLRIKWNKPLSRYTEDAKKQITFGVASGLTKTAKEGQRAVLGAMKKEFVLRGRWYEQSNKYGIRVKAAKKNDLSAEIRTAAPWLELQESGGEKKPHTLKALTVPLPETRMPGSAKKLPRQHRKKLKQKGSFILKAARKAFLVVRKTYKRKASVLQFFYEFRDKVRVEKRPFWREPIEKGLDRRLAKNVSDAIDTAIRSSKI